MNRLHLSLFASLLATCALLPACNTDGSGGSCTDAACSNLGSALQFTFTEPGEYRFELDIDGKAVECTAALPVRGDGGGCNDGAVQIQISGSERLPDDQHSVGPIYVRGNEIKRVSAQAFRDGAAIGSAAYDVEYTKTPGPNGPDCEPKQCVDATGGELR